jgi:hypothetical protein
MRPYATSAWGLKLLVLGHFTELLDFFPPSRRWRARRRMRKRRMMRRMMMKKRRMAW